jgi:hypothetical protein
MTETQSQFAGSEDLNPNVATGVLLDDIAARIGITPRVRWASIAPGSMESDDSLRGRVLGAIRAALPPSDAALDHAGHSVGLPGAAGGTMLAAGATASPGHVAAPANPRARLSVTLDLAAAKPDAETRKALAAALCLVAISVATGMSEGVVDEADGTVVARFRIEG